MRGGNLFIWRLSPKYPIKAVLRTGLVLSHGLAGLNCSHADKGARKKMAAKSSSLYCAFGIVTNALRTCAVGSVSVFWSLDRQFLLGFCLGAL